MGRAVSQISGCNYPTNNVHFRVETDYNKHTTITINILFPRSTAQFRPGDTANPNIGTVGTLEEVPEVRFETLCVGEETIRHAVEALKKVHPYEEPAYEVYKLEAF
ncbi:hypothetical protein EYC80_003657 [Monilinia laxa]|uniref:ATP phosphoribosyltransferase n=1 Tax=Monilinia laxa TaxID=61186 RepID=A0A5N6KKB6_MONLA|nr:hypothetical protein EYC80_003657 [Monilinia laxa]